MNFEIFGYIIYTIHLFLSLVLNLGWIFISNVAYLHILLFCQTVTILSWNVFDGQCIITIFENWLIDVTRRGDSSITTKFLMKYLPESLVIHLLVFILFFAMIITLIKRLYVKHILISNNIN